MNSKDKNSFLIVGIMLAYFIITLGMITVTKRLNPYVIFGISMLIQCIILKPQIIANYYKMQNTEMDYQRFIPILNEFAIFPMTVIKCEIIFAVLSALTMGATQLPLTIWGAIFSQSTAISMPFKLMLLSIVFLFISSFARGIGYINLSREVKKVIKAHYNERGAVYKDSLFSFFGFVALLFPIVRVIGLVDVYSTLNSAVKLRRISTETETKTFKEVSE